MAQLDEMTKKELFAEADKAGVSYDKRWPKAKIIEAIGGEEQPMPRSHEKPIPAPRKALFRQLIEGMEAERIERAARGDASARRLARGIKQLIRIERSLP